MNTKGSFERKNIYKRHPAGYMCKKEKRVEFIGGSHLYIIDTWLVDGLAVFAIHGLATLPYPPPGCSGGCQATEAMVFKF